MLTITDGGTLARALNFPLDHRLGALLLKRQEQLGGDIAGIAKFVIVQPRDRSNHLEEVLGFSVFQNLADGTWYGDPDYSPGFDVLIDHGFAYEMTFEFTADFTHVVFVENAPGAPRRLLNLCAVYASEHA